MTIETNRYSIHDALAEVKEAALSHNARLRSMTDAGLEPGAWQVEATPEHVDRAAQLLHDLWQAGRASGVHPAILETWLGCSRNALHLILQSPVVPENGQ